MLYLVNKANTTYLRRGILDEMTFIQDKCAPYSLHFLWLGESHIHGVIIINIHNHSFLTLIMLHVCTGYLGKKGQIRHQGVVSYNEHTTLLCDGVNNFGATFATGNCGEQCHRNVRSVFLEFAQPNELQGFGYHDQATGLRLKSRQSREKSNSLKSAYGRGTANDGSIGDG